MEKFLALSQEKQATIRNAALACFARHGYEKTSINDIEVSQRRLYSSILEISRHFTSIYLITALPK